MRTLGLIVILLLVACGKGDSKPGENPSANKPSGDPVPAGTREMTVKGTLALGGVATASISWTPDLALSCACIHEDRWMVEATLQDGKGGFVALRVSTVEGDPHGGITLGGNILSMEGFEQKDSGFRGSCKLDMRNTDGVISIDLDGTLTGKPGTETVKGHLDVVCRGGL